MKVRLEIVNMVLLAIKSRHDDNSFESNFIADSLGSDWVHSEIVFPEQGYISFSSWQDVGTAFQGLSGRMINPIHWEFYEIPVNANTLWAWCSTQVGKPYTTAVATLNAIGVPYSSPKGWFCSEITYYALKQNGAALPDRMPHMIFPFDLRKMAMEVGLKRFYF